MKASKKFLSLLLVLTMVFSFAATTASAEGFLIFGGNSSSEPQSSQPVPETTTEPTTEPEQGMLFTAGEDDNTDEEKPEETKAPEESEKPEVTDPVAIIVGTKKNYNYASLEEAIAAAAEGATIQLAKDITLTKPLTISKNLTLELAEATITFKGDANYDAALVVDSGAVVTINEGELSFALSSDKDGNAFGFVSGVYAEDGTVNLVNMMVNGAVNGGSKLVAAEDGSINVMIGEFDFDPSAFTSEEFPVTEIDGMYYVTYEPADNEEIPPATNEIKPNQDGDVILNSADTEDDLKIATGKYKDKLANVTGAITLNLNGKTLTGDITVAAGATLRIINSGELHPTTGQPKPVDAAGITGNITVNGNLIIEDEVKIDGKVAMGDNGTLTVNEETVEVNEIALADKASADKISGSVTAGKFTTFAAGLQARLIPSTHKYDDATKTVVLKTPIDDTKNNVTDASGNAFNTTNNYPQYFKGKTELASAQSLVRLDSTVFKMGAEPSKISIDTTEIPKAQYTWDGTKKTLVFNTVNDSTSGENVVTIPAFEKASAGAHNIVFTFTASGGEVTNSVPVFVWPSVETAELKHVVGEEAGVKLKVSDEPKHVVVDDKELTGTDWTWADGTLSITAPALDALTPGDRLLGISYDAGELNENSSVFYNALSIINVTPVEANKDNKWLNSNTALSYNASHEVTAVSVKDSKGTPHTLTRDTDFSCSDKNVLSLKAAFLKSLPYGEHTMVVTLAGKEVPIKFTTAPSLVPKDATNHTKGGQKDLVFIASDPMDTVWVGKTQLKADYYTISSDGKTITLKAAFLNTLKADTTYNITTAKSNGNNGYTYNAVSSFRILSAASAGATPGTGDSANFGLWIALLVISGAAIAVILPKRRKEN